MKKIQLDEFINFKFLSAVKYSPDGKYACFVVSQANVEENNYSSNLWLYNIHDNKYFQLTASDKESNFIWMDDSQHILFTGLRDSKDKDKKEKGEEFTQFYKISVNGGEAQKAFKIPYNVKEIKQIDDNKYIFKCLFNPFNKDITKLSEIDKKEELKRRKEEKDYEVLDEIPFWGNGAGFTNKNRHRLCIYSLDTGNVQVLTDKELNLEGFELNKEKTKVVFTGNSFTDKMEIQNTIYISDLATAKIEQVTPIEKFRYSNVYFLTESQLICTGNDMKEYGMSQNGKFYLININSKERKCITPEFDYAARNSVGTDSRLGAGGQMKIDGKYLYFLTTERDSAFLNKIDINGTIEKVISQKGAVDDFDVIDGDILFIAFRGMKLQEIYKLEDSKEIQLTKFNELLMQERKVATLESISVKADSGVQIDGWVMKPVDFEEGKKYPGILDIHGGPKTVYGEIFFHEMQYWASQGYVVFFCNPRGSDGKGNEFADIRGKYGTIDYDDIMKFTDAVLEKYPFIDKERVGVTGGSYGGFMTNWIIGHTDRFKAAVSQRSISNWISKFCTTDIGYYFVEDQNAGTPWDNQEKLWYHSPLKYADKVKTPTLFIHSEEDYRCWVVEGLQMFTALKYYGVESKLVMFKGENHELSRGGKPKQRIRRLREITDWFNLYL